MPSNGNGWDEKSEQQPAIFEEVLDAELAYFTSRSPGKRYTGAECEDGTHACDSDYAAKVVERAHEAKLSGIAFSGGGTRSATFNLGVLQALARFDLLKEFNYLSTVSGGGYIGRWLAAWIRRENQNKSDCGEPPSAEGAVMQDGLERVSAALAAAAGEGHDRKPHGAMQPDPSPIWYLREYSNYLTPHCGFLSTDAWTLGAAYIRNLLLTLGVLLGTVAALVLLAQAYASGFGQLIHDINLGWFELAEAAAPALGHAANAVAASPESQPIMSVFTWPYVLFALLLSGTAMLLGIELSPHRTRSARTSILAYVAVALGLGAAAAGSLWLVTLPTKEPELIELLAACGPLIGGVMTLGFAGRWFGNHGLFGDARPEDQEADRGAMHWLLAGSVLGLMMMVVLWRWASLWMSSWCPAEPADLENMSVVVWGVPVFVAIFSAAAAVFVGVAGSALKELEREWLARFFAALAKWTLLYTLLMALVVYSFYAVTELSSSASEAGHDYLASGLGGLWALLSAAGAYFAREKPASQPGVGRWLRQALIVIAPSVFSLGLLIITVWGTSLATHALVTALLPNAPFSGGDKAAWLNVFSFFTGIEVEAPAAKELLTTSGYWAVSGALGLLLFLITVYWSRRVGVNDFSLHALYGNRLIRAYLGASHLHRRAHPFTGFDSTDNSVRMSELMTPADRSFAAEAEGKTTGHKNPYLIVNAAVNLVYSHRLAWQKRKAASFTFTPQFCGYEFCDEDSHGHAAHTYRTGGYANSKYYGGEGGVSLGKAMTISGAAASPNMGYHSSPALGFLMTTFNVRLGWWLPNTAMSNTGLLSQRGPKMGLLYLITEALGLTDARKDYVYLSDGGHFENLAIYELVRRRCRIVIACDGEADPDLTFSGLGNAIQKCRIDLGVPINIDVSQIRRDMNTGNSRWHCAIGCIRYSEADPGNHDGALLYIKTSMSGDEPQDVATYAQVHPSFPHEPTADQWFDEGQFESYRELGEHIATRVLSNAVEIANRHQQGAEHPTENRLERIFLELRRQWYPHTEPTNVKLADHDRMLQELVERLRTDSSLTFLDSHLYPNLQRIADEGRKKHPDGSAAAHDHHWPWQVDQGAHAELSAGAPRVPADATELRSGFYFCKEATQFMHTVFQDRRLDTEYGAPSNRGWMNMFRRWAMSPMFRFTWAVTAGTYGAPFQSFCEFHLGLDSGEPHIDREHTLGLIPRRYTSTGETAQETLIAVVTEGETDLTHPAWLSREDETGLHRYERCLIDEFIRAYAQTGHIKLLGENAKFTVYPLRLETDNVSPKIRGESTVLNAGFFLLGPTPAAESGQESAVLYFRIRSSMRNMDLARRAFIEIGKPPRNIPVCLVHDLPEAPEPEDGESVRRRAFRELHRLERENVERCRWFAQLHEETASESRTAQSGEEAPARD